MQCIDPKSGKPYIKPYAKLVKKRRGNLFFEYCGKVDAVMENGRLDYLRLVKPKDGDDICHFDRKDNDVLAKYIGKTISISGKYNKNTGIVKAMIKR